MIDIIVNPESTKSAIDVWFVILPLIFSASTTVIVFLFKRRAEANMKSMEAGYIKDLKVMSINTESNLNLKAYLARKSFDTICFQYENLYKAVNIYRETYRKYKEQNLLIDEILAHQKKLMKGQIFIQDDLFKKLDWAYQCMINNISKWGTARSVDFKDTEQLHIAFNDVIDTIKKKYKIDDVLSEILEVLPNLNQN